jgi:hypothetical protein
MEYGGRQGNQQEERNQFGSYLTLPHSRQSLNRELARSYASGLSLLATGSRQNGSCRVGFIARRCSGRRVGMVEGSG